MKEDTNHSKEHDGDEDQLLATNKTEEILQHNEDSSNNIVTLGFLEVVYGVLFEPVKTMQKVAQKPPLLTTLLVVTLLSLLSATTGFLTFTRAFGGGSGANDIFPPIHLLVPIGVVAGFVFSYVKWFGGSAILHLIADLLGGRGRVKGVFAAVGLAGLPHILLVPFQLLGYRYGLQSLPVSALLFLVGLTVWVWSSIILIIGLRETHHFSTGRAVTVFIIPYLTLLLLLILLLIPITVLISSFPLNTNTPSFF